jgi:hypothetical protein
MFAQAPMNMTTWVWVRAEALQKGDSTTTLASTEMVWGAETMEQLLTNARPLVTLSHRALAT